MTNNDRMTLNMCGRRDSQKKMMQNSQNYQEMMDALSANICLLGKKGDILLVNTGWKTFADSNGCTLGDYGIGRNYIDDLNNTANCTPFPEEPKLVEDLRIAKLVADGISTVLSGKIDKFQIRYPCHFAYRGTLVSSDSD